MVRMADGPRAFPVLTIDFSTYKTNKNHQNFLVYSVKQCYTDDTGK